jgi:hypothetical protein
LPVYEKSQPNRILISLVVPQGRLRGNGSGLAEGGEFKVQMFVSVEMLNRISWLKFSKNAPLLANPCWVQLVLI